MTQDCKASSAGAIKTCAARAVLLLLTAFVSAAWAGNVLIMNGKSGSSFGGADATRIAATNSLRSELASAGHTVTVSDEIPQNLSIYDHIWDIDFAHAIPDAGLKQYVAYLQSNRTLFVIGENAAFASRNASILGLINAMGGGSLVFQAPGGDDDQIRDGPQSIETVRSPFNGPNAIPGGTIAFGAPGGVTGAGNGQFVTFRANTPQGVIPTGAGVVFNRLVVIFDVNFLENIPDPASSQPLIRNLIAYAPAAQVPTIATVASDFVSPHGVAAHNGVLYVADQGAHAVWKIDLNVSPPTRERIAGLGRVSDEDDGHGYNGDGIDATTARLHNPTAVAVYAEGTNLYLYVADTGNHAVRRVPLTGPGAVISTVAGTALQFEGPNTLHGPRGVAVAADGTVYVADTMNQQVRRLDTAGVLSVLAGVAGVTGANDGPVSCPPAPPAPCSPAKFNSPIGITIDSEGTVFVADEGSNSIRTIAGSQVLTLPAGALLRPTGVAITPDGTALYVADYGNHRIQRISGCGVDCAVATVAGTGSFGFSGDGGPATAAALNSPIGLAFADGDLYIADLLNLRIRRVDFTPPIP